jgi:YidC/Oxa1 family membrane protein insertase
VVSEADRRALLAVVLSLGVYMLWMAWLGPTTAPVDGAVDPSQSVTESSPLQTGSAQGGAAAATPVAQAAQAPEATEAYGRPTWTGQATSWGGHLRQLAMVDYREPVVVTPWWSWIIGRVTGDMDGGWTAFSGGAALETTVTADGAYGLTGAGTQPLDQCVRSPGADLAYTCSNATGLSVTKRFLPGTDPNSLAIELTWTNGGASAVADPWVAVVDRFEGSIARFDNKFRPEAWVDDGFEQIDDSDDLRLEAQGFDEPASWFGVGDRYFMAVLAPADGVASGLRFDTLVDGRQGTLFSAGALAPGATRTERYVGYVGPKQLSTLEPLGLDLDEAVQFGWFGFFGRILLFLLSVFHAGLKNWGLAIIALTILVKLVFFPLTHKAFASGRRMQNLQPKLNELKERFKDNKEQQTQETMKLFKDEGVNPLGGCLPTLVQLPVWIALYNVMIYSAELYGTSFLYLQDLTAVDPYGILPTLVAVLYFVQQQLTPMTGLDPAQQKIMKLMPLVFAAFMYGFPSGLVLYFSVNTSLTILQQWWIYRTLGPAPQQAQPAR